MCQAGPRWRLTVKLPGIQNGYYFMYGAQKDSNGMRSPCVVETQLVHETPLM